MGINSVPTPIFFHPHSSSSRTLVVPTISQTSTPNSPAIIQQPRIPQSVGSILPMRNPSTRSIRTIVKLKAPNRGQDGTPNS